MSWIPDEWPQVSLATRLEVDCSHGRTRSRAMAMKNISLGIDDHLAGDLSKCWGSSVGRRKEENSNLRSGAKVDSNEYYTHTSHYLSPALDECNLLSINEAVQEEEKKQFSSPHLNFPPTERLNSIYDMEWVWVFFSDEVDEVCWWLRKLWNGIGGRVRAAEWQRKWKWWSARPLSAIFFTIRSGAAAEQRWVWRRGERRDWKNLKNTNFML